MSAAMPEQGRSVSDRLCAYAAGLEFEQIPGAVIARTKHLLMNFLACALGGHRVAESTAPLVAGVRSLVRGAQGASTVIGEPDLYPPHYAALLNGAIAHSMDFDDIHREAVMHPAVTIFPTLLALAEESGASGRDFLAAAVVGYDVANKIGKAHRTFVHERGFHPTATTGIFACTAAGARLLRLPLDQLQNAFGMNISQAAGSLQYEVNGAWDKRIHTGLAAHNAILSLSLARHGYKGSSQPLEGRCGYFALYANRPVNAEQVLSGLGTDFEVMNTAVKPYPTCRCNHSAIDSIIAMVADNNLEPSAIEAIEVELSEYSYRIVGDPPALKRSPASIVEAQFSMYFAAAAAARDGGYSWRSYAALDDPDVRDLMGRVTVQPRSDVGQYGCRVAIRLRDGGRLYTVAELPRGEPEQFLAADEFEAGLREWATPVIGAARTAALLQQIDALQALPDMRALTRCLRGEPSGSKPHTQE